MDDKEEFKTVAIGVGILIIVMGTFYAVMGPPDKQPDTVAEKYIGQERLRSTLKDPNSLQIISEKVENGEYKATYRAKNGFGGYNGPENFSTK